MIYLIYAVIILVANVLGAVVGMGGSVLIKPMLDMIGAHPLVQINFFSSVAVLTMAIASTLRQRKQGAATPLPTLVALAIGSVVGGVLGDQTFNRLLAVLPAAAVNRLQIILTIASLALALAYSYWPVAQGHWTHPGLLALLAATMGWLATLLGIGGGPINVALFMAVCGIPIKQATIWSIVMILFSQLAKVAQVIAVGQLWAFDLSVLWVVIPTAAVGGVLGAMASKLFQSSRVTLLYRGAIVVVCLINAYNGIELMLS